MDLSFDASISQFDVPIEAYLAKLKSRQSLDGLATGAIIFSKQDPMQRRMLLIQRASHDSMPNMWEIPGGAVDPGETVLEGVVREVREESGLRVTRVNGLVAEVGTIGFDGGYLFHTTRRMKIIKYTFIVEVEDTSEVILDPNEHQDYVWATEEECRTGKVVRDKTVELVFTAPQKAMVLRAFTWQMEKA